MNRPNRPCGRTAASALLILGLCGLAATADAATIAVPADQPSIQAAINHAISGVDEVVVAPGIYTGPIDFLGKAITVRSSGGPAETIINPGGADRAVSMINAEPDGAILEGFTITGGTAQYGGGIAIVGGAPTIANCTFSANTAHVAGGGAWLSGDTDAAFINCIFIDNAAGSLGGGLYLFATGDGPAVTNCTFSGNAASIGPAILADKGHLDVTNTIVWHRDTMPIGVFAGSVSVSYSCVRGGWSGNGNIAADPQFVDRDAGDLRLAATSPCIDRGKNGNVAHDHADVDGDGDFDERTPLDFLGRPRLIDGDNDGIVAVDIGAFEYQAGRCDPDLTGDLHVNVADLLHLLASWGHCDGCYEDVDDSGAVDATDLLAVLTAWGPCD